jgi:hypothetical protein
MEDFLSSRDGPQDQTSDAQLRIGESRDSGFALRTPRNDGCVKGPLGEPRIVGVRG